MVSRWSSKGKERELLQLLAESALNDYPNPERIGCSGQEFLRTLAFRRKSIPVGDPRLNHVVHCSPCFRQFTDFQAAARHRRNARWAASSTIAAAIAIAVALWITSVFGRLTSNGGVNGPPIVAEINFQNRPITRGGPPFPQQNEIIVPRGQLKLTILLPFGSGEGSYDVQIRKEVDKALIATSGRAAIVEGVTRLSIFLNTSSLPPGKYLLGIRHPPLDWAFSSITIH